MPATKIETGVLIELKRLVLTPNARKHKPEKIASLAKSMKELDTQLEDIIVCPQDEAAGCASPFFDVLAGGGRKLAEESLGWEKGRCTIMYGLSPYEKLKVTLDENKERQETSPLDDAKLYQAMMDAEPGLTQEELAERLGVTRSSLADYLSLIQLPGKVQDFVARATNLGIKHILQLCRLKTPDDQIALAQEASQKELSVKELKNLVDKKVKEGAGENKAKNIRQRLEALYDRNGVKFKESGSHVIVTAPYERTGKLKDFLAHLEEEINLWCRQHPYTPGPEEAAAKAKEQQEQAAYVQEQDAYAKMMEERQAYLAQRAAATPVQAPSPTPPPAAEPPSQ